MESQIKGILLYYMHCCRGSLYLTFRSPLVSRPMQFLVCSVWFILQFTDIPHCYDSIVLKGFSNLYLQAAVILLIHMSWKESHVIWNTFIRVKLGPTAGHAIKQMGCPSLCVHSWYALVMTKSTWQEHNTIKNLQAGFILCHGYSSEKLKSQKFTQNFHLKQHISWRVGDWQSHSILCMTIPLIDIQTCKSIYALYAQCMYADKTAEIDVCAQKCQVAAWWLLLPQQYRQ
jgi:hypothetical protein